MKASLEDNIWMWDKLLCGWWTGKAEKEEMLATVCCGKRYGYIVTQPVIRGAAAGGEIDMLIIIAATHHFASVGLAPQLQHADSLGKDVLRDEERVHLVDNADWSLPERLCGV
jgi:hypothetical protein